MKTDEWFSVLKLAKMWYFAEIHAIAVDKITTQSMDPVEMIVLAKEYFVTTWLKAGYVQLVNRKSVLSVEEAGRIGFPSGILVFHVREKKTAGASGSIESWVQTTFAEELKDMEKQHQHFTFTGWLR